MSIHQIPAFRAQTLSRPVFGAAKPAAEPSLQEQLTAVLADPDKHEYSGEPLRMLRAIATMQTPEFAKERQKVVDAAKAYIKEQLAANPDLRKNGAVVMDLDDTLIDCLPENLKMLLERTPYHPDCLIDKHCPAIPEVLEFFQWVRKQELTVFFITARYKHYIPTTERNLRNIGIPPSQYGGLDHRDTDKYPDRTLYKAEVKREIEEERPNADGEHYKIIVEMGDQESDFAGARGKTFKLPNDLYNV